MAKELKFVLLLDCYGELLTDKQRDYMELYYCEDLSLAEISEPQGITRQAVRDVIKRSEQILLETEEKLGFAARLGLLRECFEEIRKVSEQCTDKNSAQMLDICVEKGMKLI